MIQLKSYLIIIICVVCGLSIAQNKTIDSLKLTLKNLPSGAKHDTTRCRILNSIVQNESIDEKWEPYNDQLLKISESKLKTISRSDQEYNTYLDYYAVALHNAGYLANKKGNILMALDYDERSLKLFEELGDKTEIASALNNLGAIYQNQGDIPKALKYHERSLKIMEEIEDKQGIAQSLNNIATVYQAQGDIGKALEYYNRSLKIREEIGDKKAQATTLNNIGSVYKNFGDPAIALSKESSIQEGVKKALEYYNRSLKLREEIGDKMGVAYSLNNIGKIYQISNNPSASSPEEMSTHQDPEKALNYFERSLSIWEELGFKQGMAIALNNIGGVYLSKKNNKKALEYYTRSMDISKEIGFPDNIKGAALQLSKMHKATGNHKLALENYELYIQMRDSINNESTRKASIKSQLKYEYEKQAAADSVAHAKESEIKNAELAKQKAEISAKKNQQYALFGGLFGVCVFGVFMFNRYKVTQKQKRIIESQKAEVENQKNLVEEKQKEILDSIQYAKKIQMALIQSEKRVEHMLKRLRS